MANDLKELAQENLWNINNRWGSDEQLKQAKLVAEKIVALANGEVIEPVVQPTPEITRPSIPPIDNYSPPDWLVDGDMFPIVGQRFTQAEFVEYVKWVIKNEEYHWRPTGITMHHTAYPDLAMRPNGFTSQQMLNCALV